MLNKTLTILIIVLISISCKDVEVESTTDLIQEEKNLATDIDWISGSWVDSTSFKMINQTYVEKWESQGQDSYQGIKYSIKGGKNGDTTKLKIDKAEGKYYYTIIDNSKESVFIQTKITINEIEFANTKNEFPHNINYQIDNSKLAITASGDINGEFKVITFNTLRE